ncbi:putative thiamine transport system ATP-binding protein [Rubricella aquisinus]|uniref:Putative thiamine transport system ATP-binding protein n=1 Tax=Rubricella aquisinus TaxID=2028108 RepID=A0A840WJE2_9RHOB|nr:ATP-binding cassette domain-containing protein [Rubricella aquisinus]MBB5515218.1 putative thiamine transport system ATP-binding protein [Rubricella aquisinus]
MKDGLHILELEIAQRGRVLVSLDLKIAPGEIVTIMGPSGSGKSTLLSALIGALAPEFEMRGHVLLNGIDITDLSTRQRRIGLLFQDDTLFPHLSVGANLAFALPPTVRGKGARMARVERALLDAGLDGFSGRDPATLSGGQRARVSLMRTLIAEPNALLLDEPFSKLDADRRTHIRAFVVDRVRQRALPALLVTHDAEDARAVGGRILDPLGREISL